MPQDCHTRSSALSFLFGDLGKGKLAVITYWITKKGGAKHKAGIEKIFGSFQRAE